MEYVPRELEKTIKPFLKRKEILAIVGARQVGKTTFLEHLFSDFKKQKKKVEFLTLERKNDLALFENKEREIIPVEVKYSSSPVIGKAFSVL